MTNEAIEEVGELVIGSGPAAASATSALVAAGQRPTIVDPGLRLEADREQLKMRLARTAPDDWRSEVLEALAASGADGAVLAAKRTFGSDVAVRDPGVVSITMAPEVAAQPSYAYGGLSTIWGAGILPYPDIDLDGWPLAFADLEPSYRAALQLLPYSASNDGLSERYPLITPPTGALVQNECGAAVLSRLQHHSGRLRRNGITVGGPRLAVRAGNDVSGNGCRYCQRCLEGCPYDHIYSSSATVDALRTQGVVDYRPGWVVSALREEAAGVLVEMTALSGERMRLRASRVYVGAGAIATTAILQRSGLLARRVRIADSQTLYIPFAWAGRVGATGRGRGYTLAQAFVILDGRAGERAVHLSLYDYNPGLAARARGVSPLAARALGANLDRVLRHVVVSIAFLHSDDSHALSAELVEASGAVHLERIANPRTDAVVRRLATRLSRQLGPLGLFPLSPLIKRAPVGGGYHCGGSTPMSSSPAPGRSDLLGRPHGTRRIHVIDAACFPTIPAGTITLTVMANAHRIATAAVAAGSPP